MLGLTTTNDPGTTGIKDIADAMGGGIHEGSLIMVEGEAKSGKSILCQHLASGILNARDSSVAYYSTDEGSEGILARMDSMSLGVRHDFVTDRFRIYKMGSRNVFRNAEKSLKLIIEHIVELPERFKLVIVDSAKPFLNAVSPVAKVDFLQACKELCEDGRSIVQVIDTHVFETKTLHRAYAMSDYYLKLRSQDMMLATGQVDMRVIKVLQVTKLAGAERIAHQGIKFEIKPETGIQILPFIRVKI